MVLGFNITQDTLLNWAELITSLGTIVGVFILIYTKWIKPQTEQMRKQTEVLDRVEHYLLTTEIHQNALRSLLKAELSDRSLRIMRRGWLSIDDDGILRSSLEAYEQLEGNGSVKRIVKLALNMPIKHDDWKTQAINNAMKKSGQGEYRDEDK